jgi:hypothetical protein
VRLLPVVVHDAPAHEEEAAAAAVHIEFPDHAFVSVGGSADPVVIRAVLESLRG